MLVTLGVKGLSSSDIFLSSDKPCDYLGFWFYHTRSKSALIWDSLFFKHCLENFYSDKAYKPYQFCHFTHFSDSAWSFECTSFECR